jgi:NADH-quinone oxidoreductase subunit I
VSTNEPASDGRGLGLLKGLSVTFRAMTRRSVTQQYPDVQPELPPRSRGVIALLEENCTVCMLCARECPDWCIYIDSHKEVVPAKEPGARDRVRNVLDRFAIDFSLCMYCGICIEACPFDALFWSPEFEYAEFDVRNLLHEKERLSGWLASVPAPQQLDDAAVEPKEVAASLSRVPAPPSDPSPTPHPDEQASTEPTGMPLLRPVDEGPGGPT